MSIVHILKLDLKLFPYRIQIKHKLTANDEKTRVDMRNWFDDKMEENQDLDGFFSDEAHLYLDGYLSQRTTYLGNCTATESVTTALLQSYCMMCHKLKNQNWAILV